MGKVRGDARLADLPVLLVSYKDRPEDVAAARAAGASGYISKAGMQGGGLLREVAALLPGRKS